MEVTDMSLARLIELLEPAYAVVAPATDAQELAVQNQHLQHQIAIEVVLTATGAAHIPGAGTLQIAYKPKGAAAYEDFSGTQDLTAAPLTVTKDGCFDSLQFTPANLDGDCSFRIRYVGYRV
jgi:F420-0:gamma-glutamyl ligase